MKRSAVSCLALMFMGILLTRPALAETVKLKSGTTVNGKIIYRTDRYVKMDFHDIFISLYLDDIESIDGEKISLSEKASKKYEKQAVAAIVVTVTTPGGDAASIVMPHVRGAETAAGGRTAPKARAPDQRVKNPEISVMLNGRTIKISLPREWVNLPKYAGDAARPAAVFVRDYPKAEFDIFVSDLGDEPGFGSREYQIKFLDERKADLQREARELGYEWVSDGYSEIFDVPCLITTYGPARRNLYFIKDYRLYTVKFRAKSEDGFEKEWAGVEQGIKSIELMKAR